MDLSKLIRECIEARRLDEAYGYKKDNASSLKKRGWKKTGDSVSFHHYTHPQHKGHEVKVSKGAPGTKGMWYHYVAGAKEGYGRGPDSLESYLDKK